jgi:hypothetical protein
MGRPGFLNGLVLGFLNDFSIFSQNGGIKFGKGFSVKINIGK